MIPQNAAKTEKKIKCPRNIKYLCRHLVSPVKQYLHSATEYNKHIYTNKTNKKET